MEASNHCEPPRFRATHFKDLPATVSRMKLPSLIQAMANHRDLWEMGHNQDYDSKDLGLGWIYYGLVRSYRPSVAVVIGSWRGFVPLVVGQGIQDNANQGKLIFIDPSFVDDFWRDQRADMYFSSFGINCIRHYCQTSQEFIASKEFSSMEVDFLFIDGMHTEEQCRLEFEAFYPKLTTTAVTLFHDSRSRVTSHMYGENNLYDHTTYRYIENLRGRPDLQVFDIPIGQGVAIVERLG